MRIYTRKGMTVVCLRCGKESYARPSHVRRAIFCSRQCRWQYGAFPEHRRKISASLRRAYAEGRKKLNPMLGRYPLTAKQLERREQFIRFHRVLSGRDHWNWQGGFASGANRKAYQALKAKEWNEKNHARRIYLNHVRYLRQMGAPGSHTLEEWEELKRRCGFACVACGRKEPDISLTEDHIKPLSKGGGDNIENIQPLCRSCNSRKQANEINYLLVA